MKRISLSIIEGPDYSVDGDGWEHNRYRLRLRHDGRSMTVPFMMGRGRSDAPGMGAVMSSLLMDASTAEQFGPADVWAFMEEFGYDKEGHDRYDRCAKMLRQIHTQTDNLSNLVGRGMMLALIEDEDATCGSAERFAAAWDRLSD